jgi:hypothetical protein
MRALSKSIAAAAGAIALASSAFAAEGKYEGLLLQALMANAEGECPAAVMRDVIKKSCESQLPALKDTFSKLGAFKEITFQSTRVLDGGPGEVYKVSFTHGEWIWVLNARDGKIYWGFAPDPPTWDIGSYSRKPAER